jgi:hypothetical protein
VPVARVLLAAGAEINERCEYGTTALHIAVSWAQLEMVEYLVGAGADVRLCDDDGRTPLEMARAGCIRMKERMALDRISAEAETWLARIPPVIDFLSSYRP